MATLTRFFAMLIAVFLSFVLLSIASPLSGAVQLGGPCSPVGAKACDSTGSSVMFCNAFDMWVELEACSSGAICGLKGGQPSCSNALSERQEEEDCHAILHRIASPQPVLLFTRFAGTLFLF
ncbi:uncharacterized protein LY89DRAFT_726891 [Mollisia scopiformis]|uniref:Uncharacterized protein n=1 Tax=Mollisia scopiformis TaxID=149040 RepID=A0A194XUX2_MOLSC|nr:uncharacterized protein LY89DRAFT_726891 [Mollisia scopiformis]KUJ23834.1 hypothetical protein LY89DRAFT_726891 [Mollisia scopiformis]